MINYMSEDFRVTLDVVRNEIVDVNARLNLTMRAMANQAQARGAISVSRVKILKPKPFCGARDAKALENYIFYLEQYFKATNTVTEEAKVTLATMHLSEDAKLWWRECGNPCSTKIADLNHTGKIREYVKQFAGLMLDIRDMLEKDKVFCFVEGLKPWAKAKLYEQRVQDLTSAYAVAERLFDLTSDSQDVRRHQSSSPGRNKNSRPSSPKAVGGDECPSKDRRPHQSNTENTWRWPNNRSSPKRPLSCFICGRPHRERECPNKIDFHAFQASLIADSDGKSNQAEDEVTKITVIDSGATHNFITEAEARRLRLHWEKDSGRMKAVNYVALPIVELVKRTTIKLGGWKGPVDFVVVKMDNFDVVLRMEFLLEHQVIPMPSAKCLGIIGSFPTVVQADIRQPNGFKMISAMQLDKSPAQEEPPSAAILLGALGKLGETVPKDTLCVLEKCHDAPNSWSKSLSMRRTIDHGIELLPEAKASVKNAYRMAPPELAKLWKPSKMLLNIGFSRPVQASYGVHALSLKKKDRSPQQCIDRRIHSKHTVPRKYSLPAFTRLFDHPCRMKYFPKSDIRSRYCRVRTTKAKGLETTCVTEQGAYEFPVVPFSLTDAKGGKCCSVQSQINVLGHVVDYHQSELLREEDTQWSGNLECQTAFNGLKQAMIKGPSLGVVDATKTPKLEVEQFSCVFEEYLHHCVDGRQKNWVQLRNVTQFGCSSQTDSLIKRSPFEIKGNRHSVLLPLTDDPYVGDFPQVHRVKVEWERMADIARVCLEESSRLMEERVDQNRCPIELEWMTKLPINSATTSYDYLSTWNWRKTEKSRKSLLTDMKRCQRVPQHILISLLHGSEVCLSDSQQARLVIPSEYAVISVSDPVGSLHHVCVKREVIPKETHVGEKDPNRLVAQSSLTARLDGAACDWRKVRQIEFGSRRRARTRAPLAVWSGRRHRSGWRCGAARRAGRVGDAERLDALDWASDAERLNTFDRRRCLLATPSDDRDSEATTDGWRRGADGDAASGGW
ncbi:uncharacterized protein E5676_scaffold571G00880 [Cucumis melo var. makuwa]|uniref:Reverse transcriptase n=1 Tax=Cucumis melo var. makuwa TaxID=1194695 RepID=A0A5D3CYE8_CUCMM|nr:uncharacterized protein E5676_scaffold571G00880 [Cucumis melo var. makuwa]